MAYLLEAPHLWLMMPTFNRTGGRGFLHLVRYRYEDRCCLKAIAAIFIGAGLGALLRWCLGLSLNSYFPSIPPGTLAANLIGGYIIGVAVAFFATYSGLAPEWRLFVITGFCGGLTTFSTFSAEVVALLQQGHSLDAFGAAALHLGGSVLMTFAGIGTVAWARA
jgi:fluoride exporter